jgi:hypothetical protein
MAVLGLAGALAAVGFGPYPVSLLLSPGSPVQNSAPPSSALLLYAAGQCGLAILVRGRLERWCERPRVWLAVVAVNAVAMSLFLWHLVPVVAVALALRAAGLIEVVQPLTPRWWATRPLWLLACAAVLVPVLALVRSAERPPRSRARRPRGPGPAGEEGGGNAVGGRSVPGSGAGGGGSGSGAGGSGSGRGAVVLLALGAVSASAGVVRLTVGGMSADGPLGLPLPGIAALGAGVLAVLAAAREPPRRSPDGQAEPDPAGAPGGSAATSP